MGAPAASSRRPPSRLHPSQTQLAERMEACQIPRCALTGRTLTVARATVAALLLLMRMEGSLLWELCPTAPGAPGKDLQVSMPESPPTWTGSTRTLLMAGVMIPLLLLLHLLLPLPDLLVHLPLPLLMPHLPPQATQDLDATSHAPMWEPSLQSLSH